MHEIPRVALFFPLFKCRIFLFPSFCLCNPTSLFSAAFPLKNTFIFIFKLIFISFSIIILLYFSRFFPTPNLRQNIIFFEVRTTQSMVSTESDMDIIYVSFFSSPLYILSFWPTPIKLFQRQFLLLLVLYCIFTIFDATKDSTIFIFILLVKAH